MSLRSAIRAGRLGWLVVLVAAAGCDQERGPGTIQVQIAADVPLGAVVVELTGKGVEGVEPLPGGWVEGSVVQGGGGTPAYRIVAVLQTPGEMDIRVRVADLDAALPRARVVQASGADDLLLDALGVVRAEVRR
jgi:hypothetical protein